jgi:hypothetical protein
LISKIIIMSTFEEGSDDESYFEEVVELSSDGDHELSIDDTEEDEELKEDEEEDKPPSKRKLNGGGAAEVDLMLQMDDEDYLFIEEEYEEEILDEFEEYEASLHSSGTESFDDNSTAYDPDEHMPREEQWKERKPTTTAKRVSDVSNQEIGKNNSEHSLDMDMDFDNLFELQLPHVPKSRQMSALTLDWDAYRDELNEFYDSVTSFGHTAGSSDGGSKSKSNSHHRNEDMWGGGEEPTSAGTSNGPIISMDPNLFLSKDETDINAISSPNEPRRSLGRNSSGGLRAMARTASGSGAALPKRGSLTQKHSGGLLRGVTRKSSGGLTGFRSPGLSRQMSRSALGPLDTLTEEKSIHQRSSMHGSNAGPHSPKAPQQDQDPNVVSQSADETAPDYTTSSSPIPEQTKSQDDNETNAEKQDQEPAYSQPPPSNDSDLESSEDEFYGDAPPKVEPLPTEVDSGPRSNPAPETDGEDETGSVEVSTLTSSRPLETAQVMDKEPEAKPVPATTEQTTSSPPPPPLPISPTSRKHGASPPPSSSGGGSRIAQLRRSYQEKLAAGSGHSQLSFPNELQRRFSSSPRTTPRRALSGVPGGGNMIGSPRTPRGRSSKVSRFDQLLERSYSINIR